MRLRPSSALEGRRRWLLFRIESLERAPRCLAAVQNSGIRAEKRGGGSGPPIVHVIRGVSAI